MRATDWRTFNESRPRSVLHIAVPWRQRPGQERRYEALCGLEGEARCIVDDDGTERCIECMARFGELMEC